VELPDERTARWVTMHIRFNASNQTLALCNLTMQSWMFDVRGSPAYFLSDDATLNAIANLSKTFIYLGMSDTFVDTPGREDGQWIEVRFRPRRAGEPRPCSGRAGPGGVLCVCVLLYVVCVVCVICPAGGAQDARPRGLIAATWFNDTTLRQVMIRHQAEAQHADGSMHPFPPSNYPATASVDW
jgi:hypothetical protein